MPRLKCKLIIGKHPVREVVVVMMVVVQEVLEKPICLLSAAWKADPDRQAQPS